MTLIMCIGEGGMTASTKTAATDLIINLSAVPTKRQAHALRDGGHASARRGDNNNQDNDDNNNEYNNDNNDNSKGRG